MKHRLLLLAPFWLLLLAGSVQGQHLGARQQWQPQTETDPRLQQHVEMTVEGRGAIAGLSLLSEKTGVSLTVAPEDLATVGERKFLLIAQGCRLKDIMVQLTVALQECHWDVADTGPELVYCLHRNSGADRAASEEREQFMGLRRQERRDLRRTRLAEARRALTLSPEQIADLEQSDLLLARTLRHPVAREALEAFFTLSPDQMHQFLDDGIVSFPYSEASPRTQRSARALIEWRLKLIPPADPSPAAPSSPDNGQSYAEQWRSAVRELSEQLPHSTLTYRDTGLDVGWGVHLFVDHSGSVVVPARYPGLSIHGGPYLPLLMETETEGTQAAVERLHEWATLGMQERERQLAERRAAVHAEPTDPRLLQTMSIDAPPLPSAPNVQRAIAEKTGLSVIADYYYQQSYNLYLDDDALGKEYPVWQLLNALACPGSSEVMHWDSAGDCLVFHHVHWRRLQDADMPETIVLEIRRKLAAQQRLTLDDVAAILSDLRDRIGMRPGLLAVPDDLRRMLGNSLHPRASWALLVYASLSPDQGAAARTEAGLQLSQLGSRHRLRIAELLPTVGGPRTDLSDAVFQIEESESGEDGDRSTDFEFRLTLLDEPEADLACKIWMGQPAPASEDGSAGRR